MRDYRNNAKWLIFMAPFRMLSISAAYLVPFFVSKGMNQSEIFLLQSVFSLTVVLLEVPSGWLADRIGRALCIQISAPLAATSMIAYGLSDHFWQFVVCEFVLGLANVLFSGADQALLIDSLKAEGREDHYVQTAQKIHSFGFAGTVVGLPVSFLIVKYLGISAALVADGLLVGLGSIFVFRLVEPPVHEAEELGSNTAWQATKQLFSHIESRWLIAMTIVLSASTYFGAWLAAPYYSSIGIPVVLFGAIYSGRSLFKAWVSRRVSIEHELQRGMGFLVACAVLPYIAIATGVPWLALVMLGHDMVHALQASPLAHRYNQHISSRYRAMLNSVVGLQTRLVYALVGPLVGLLIDKKGLQNGMLFLGFAFGLLLAVIYRKLVKLKALD